MSETPLPVGPFDDPPAVYHGTLAGNVISAAQVGGMGGMACPGDGGITTQVNGDLNAILSSVKSDGSFGEISGEFTATFGAGASQVVFMFRFRATL